MTDEPTVPTEPAPPTGRERPLPSAIVDVRGRAAAIWLVPLAALVVVASLVIRDWWSRGPLVVVALPKATGMEAGRTPVVARGVQIGRVERVRLDDNLLHPLVEVRLERWASSFAREGAVYWIVSPSIGFRGVTGLETLTSGPILEARPGPANATQATRFSALVRAPSDADSLPGLRIVLTAARLGSIRPGSPVTYRDIEVGEVVETRLADDGRTVEISAVVAERYAPLVRTGSKFWARSGIGLDLGMSGFKLRTESLEAMLGGGVAFATRSPNAPSRP